MRFIEHSLSVVAAFIMWYNTFDLTKMQDAVNSAQTDLTLTLDQRTAATQLWTGGLSGGLLAVAASVEKQEGDSDTKAVVISTISLADSRALLLTLSAKKGNEYLYALADDMSRSSGAQEPWP